MRWTTVMVLIWVAGCALSACFDGGTVVSGKRARRADGGQDAWDDGWAHPGDDAVEGDGLDDARDHAGPCAGQCGGDKPHCDARSGQCVACLGDSHCPGGVCTGEGACVECVDDSGCTDGVCDVSAHACVECLSDEDCTDSAAVSCSPDTHACTGCETSADCSRLPGRAICDTSGSTGTCVACTVDDESACGGNSCDPATHACTDTATGSLDECERCKADSECPANYRCIPMKFKDKALPDGHCLKEASKGCRQPYVVPISRASRSGAPKADYCGVEQSQTSCAAVLASIANTECNEDADCGLHGFDDGRCEKVDGLPNRCTYSCTITGRCPSNQVCDGESGGTDYCGGGY